MGFQNKMARQRAWKRQRELCFYCKVNVPKAKATLEHRIPKADGGTLSDGNGVMTCRTCNEAKGNMPENVFLAGPEAQEKWKLERANQQRATNGFQPWHSWGWYWEEGKTDADPA